MRKSESGAEIAVAVSRFGSDPVIVKLPHNSTVGEALSAAGVAIASREQAYVAGQEARNADILEDGDVVSIVTPKQAGKN